MPEPVRVGPGCGKVLVYNNIFEHGEYREQ